MTRTGQPAPGVAYTSLYRFDPEGLTFDLPASVSFDVPAVALSKPLAVYWSKSDEPSAYEDVGGTLRAGAIVAKVTHFSTGYVGEASAPGDGGVEEGGADSGPPLDASTDAQDASPEDGGAGDAGTGDGGAGDAGTGDGGGLDDGPQLQRLSTTEVLRGSGDLPITVGFLDSHGPTGATILRANGVDLPTYRYSGLALTALVPASHLAAAGTVTITAFTPRVGESNALTLAVVRSGNPAPTITSVLPATVPQNTPTNTTLAVTGSGFLSGATCYLGPFPANLGYANQGQVTCSVSTYSALTAGDLPVRIVNPGPGGGASGPGALTISGSNPPAGITSLTPSVLGVGTAPIALELGGTGLLPTTRIEAVVGSEVSPLEFQYPYAITQKPRVVIPRSLLEAPASVVIRATNQAPGGGSSTTATLEVVAGNPTPQLTSLTSSSPLKRGESGQTLTLTGSGFGAYSSVREVGTSTWLPVVSYTETTLVVTVPDSLVAQAGTLLVEVVNAAPGGGASAARTATVFALPTLTSITPSSVVAGSGSFQLTVAGTDLAQGGFRIIYVGAAQLFPGEGWTVTVPANVIAAPATLDVVAGIEGIGNSNALPLTVTPP